MLLKSSVSSEFDVEGLPLCSIFFFVIVVVDELVAKTGGELSSSSESHLKSSSLSTPCTINFLFCSS
jgi:hypothetical protein